MIFGIIGVLWIIYKYVDGAITDIKDKNYKYLWWQLTLPIVAGFVGFACYFIIGLIGFIGHEMYMQNHTESQKTEVYTDYLENIKDNTMINGTRYLGRGRINEEWEYSFYIESNGGYELQTASVDDTTIKYIYDNSLPRIEREWTVKSNSKLLYWFTAYDMWYQDTVVGRTIYVPEGTISDDYMLDAEK